MKELIEWLNYNEGFIMAILTFVYVIATILICIFNYKSASATKEQIKESNKQFIENNRAHVIPKIIVLEGEMICLCFQNIGKDIATNLIINVSEEWLKKLETTKTFPEVASSLRKLKKEEVFLTVDQQLVYGICIPGNGPRDFKDLGEEILTIDLSYKTLNNNYSEKFSIPLEAYNFMVDQSDYTRLTKKQIYQMREINKELKNINNSLKRINPKN